MHGEIKESLNRTDELIPSGSEEEIKLSLLDTQKL